MDRSRAEWCRSVAVSPSRVVRPAGDHRGGRWAAELARSVHGSEFFTPVGWADEVGLFLRDAGRMVAAMKLLRSRDDPPFDPHDIAALTLIQPLAELAYAAVLEPAPRLANERALADSGPHPREIEVARLAALGRTNDEIARTLMISVATAKRHPGHDLSPAGRTLAHGTDRAPVVRGSSVAPPPVRIARNGRSWPGPQRFGRAGVRRGWCAGLRRLGSSNFGVL